MNINNAKEKAEQWWSRRNSFERGAIIGGTMGAVVAGSAVVAGAITGTVITKAVAVAAGTITGAISGAIVMTTVEQAELNYKLRLLAMMQVTK